MKNSIFLSVVAAALASCGGNDHSYDATGTFEATEITVSAEQNGRLIEFLIDDGDAVEAGEQVALIDTVQLFLRARQIGATRLVYASQRPEIQTQIAATRQELAKAKTERERYAGLVADGAANKKLLDDAESRVAVLQKQLDAQLSSLNISTASLNAQMNTADAEQLLVADQLAKCHVYAPISGIVLETYAEPGEYAMTGKPLFKVADTAAMRLRAYLTSQQLSRVKVGQKVVVYADYGDNTRRKYEGTVAWIASKSEFTPKTILTDDERADLVYAVKIDVDNADGMLKIGMYGEVKL